ncbi:diguanylate cyclase [Kineococcus sp. SYSU DK005]|uniref:diguanylate cyclase n=1 Tax=Kineococcus sp. SYSU DK005 TaxID=3383126 RepID=UPI003D7C5820
MTALLALAFAFSGVVCALTAVLAWRRRANTPAAGALAAAMAGIALWSATGVFVHLPVELTLQRVTGRISFIGVHLTVVGLWCTSRAATDRSWRLRRAVALRLVSSSALLVGAVFTNPWHQLFFSSARASATGRLQVELGPLFWVDMAYCYLLLGWGVQHLLRAWWRARSVFRHQLSHLLLASCVPVIGNLTVLAVALVHDQRGERAVDYTPLFLALTGLIYARAIFRHGLLRLVPVARAQVVEAIEDAVVVLDADGRVVDVNPAAMALLTRTSSTPTTHIPTSTCTASDVPDAPGVPGVPVTSSDVVGQLAVQVLPAQLSALLSSGTGREHVRLAEGVHLDARVSALRGARGQGLGRVLVLRDVSELVEQRQLAQRASQRLAEQLALTQALQQRLAEEAVRDALTGLHNRRHLVQVLQEAVDHARSTGEPLSVVLIDVDRFKAVNDTYGHHGGDAVLQAVAARLQRGCRQGDTLARYGGEEFVLLLPATTAAQAVRRVEQLRRECAQTRVDLPCGEEGTSPRRRVAVAVTFSAGVATCPERGTTGDELLVAADRALYAAKAGGRDRVVTAR